MKEIEIIKAKLAGLSAEQIRGELERIERGIACAQSKGALRRYETRRALYQDELIARAKGITGTVIK